MGPAYRWVFWNASRIIVLATIAKIGPVATKMFAAMDSARAQPGDRWLDRTILRDCQS